MLPSVRMAEVVRTKILSPNIGYFVANSRFVAIYALFGRLWAKSVFWAQNNVLWLRNALLYGTYIKWRYNLGNRLYHWYSGGLTWAIFGISTNIKTLTCHNLRLGLDVICKHLISKYYMIKHTIQNFNNFGPKMWILLPFSNT